MPVIVNLEQIIQYQNDIFHAVSIVLPNNGPLSIPNAIRLNPPTSLVNHDIKKWYFYQNTHPTKHVNFFGYNYIKNGSVKYNNTLGIRKDGTIIYPGRIPNGLFYDDHGIVKLLHRNVHVNDPALNHAILGALPFTVYTPNDYVEIVKLTDPLLGRIIIDFFIP